MASAFSLRDTVRLQGVHPNLITNLDLIFAEMAKLGHAMFVVMGVRTAVQQAALYAQGRSTPGPRVRPGHPLGDVVTMKDGVVHKSNHQPHADGLGYAVDCAFLGVANPFADDLPWELYGQQVEHYGLRWGGRWSHPHDAPHAEYPTLAQ